MEQMTASVPGFRLTAEAVNGVLHAQLVGELDLAGREPMDELMAWVGRQGADSPLVIDLSQTSFIDSSGVRMLLETTTTSRRVALLSPSPPVGRVLEITGLRDRFTEIASLDDPVLTTPAGADT
jgi:anti-anti-sigma factor